ncbi:MAG: aminotransferase class V-fold PLP-dependent enzyme [Pseudomonadota bacterium]
MKLPIYLDYNATTPVAPGVADAMLPFLREHFGNPSSSHPFGRLAAQAVAEARSQVAALIGARADEIVFTSCATESNNLAPLGVARDLGNTKRHLVVSAIEHPAVMAPAKHLQDKDWDLTVVPVDEFGRVSPEAIARALRDQLHVLLIDAIPGLILNGHPDQRLPNTLHISFPGASGRRLLDQASHIVAASLGSACHSEHDAVSGVLAAMGADSVRATGAVRLSVGAMTTPDEVSRAANGLIDAWRTVASL